MKNPFKIIAAFLLISVSANSQTSYPVKIEFNGDTVVAITIPQMDAIWTRLTDCSRLPLADSIIASQSKEIDVCSRLNETQRKQITDLKLDRDDLKGIADLEHEIILNKDRLIVLEKRKNRRNLFIGLPVSFGVGVAAGLLIGLFGHR